MKSIKPKIAKRWLTRNKWKIARWKARYGRITPKFRRQLTYCLYNQKGGK